MAEMPGGVALATRDDCVVTADHVVFCTGYEVLPCMESRSRRITSTWALASRPRLPHPAWLDDFLVWEAAAPYLYFRTTPQGRIVAGGEDEDSPDRNDDPALLTQKAERIAAKLRALTGIEIGTPACVWAAPFGNTTDRLPIIDRVPGHDRAYAVMGFGGNGITFSMLSRADRGGDCGQAGPRCGAVRVSLKRVRQRLGREPPAGIFGVQPEGEVSAGDLRRPRRPDRKRCA